MQQQPEYVLASRDSDINDDVTMRPMRALRPWRLLRLASATATETATCVCACGAASAPATARQGYAAAVCSRFSISDSAACIRNYSLSFSVSDVRCALTEKSSTFNSATCDQRFGSSSAFQQHAPRQQLGVMRHRFSIPATALRECDSSSLVSFGASVSGSITGASASAFSVSVSHRGICAAA